MGLIQGLIMGAIAAGINAAKEAKKNEDVPEKESIFVCPQCRSVYGFGPSQCGRCKVNTLCLDIGVTEWNALSEDEHTNIILEESAQRKA